jgi:hypothetical protein
MPYDYFFRLVQAMLKDTQPTTVVRVTRCSHQASLVCDECCYRANY